jgi:ribosomal protein S18 acetylase RimI-like enzyme
LDLDLPQRNNAALQFKRNSADVENILQHWKECEITFYEHLSARVNLEEYVQKIQQYAQRVEAWHEGKLIGFVAYYANNSKTAFGYITNISVAKQFGGKGVGRQLFELCYQDVKERSFRGLQLHVAATNKQAIGFYTQLGFLTTEQANGLNKMELKIR